MVLTRPNGSFEPQRIPVEDLWIRLASSANGLSDAEARDRLLYEGPNAIMESHPPPLVIRLGRHLVHPFALLLCAGAMLSFFGEYFSPGGGMAFIGAALVLVVVVNASFTFWQELRVEKAMAAFRGLLSRHARVVRDAAEVEIDATEVVVGDVLVLREGDRIAADARLFESHALKVDNAPLTGESEPQLRTTSLASGSRLDARNLVFAGTLVTSGAGAAVVYAIGNHTEIGSIAGVTRETQRVETPIKRELRYFIRLISIIATGIGLVFFLTGWLIGNPFWTNLVFAVGIIVANVPEGLLPTVTLGLAIAGRKMARRNALLKTLESAETLGGTTVICTDKTGTITRNDMRVTDVLLGIGATEAAPGAIEAEPAIHVMALCNNATMQNATMQNTAPRGQSESSRFRGDPTETALLRYVESVAPGAVYRLRGEYRRLYERPFDSATKEMATVHQMPGGLTAMLKGAPEVVVQQCAYVLRDGIPCPITTHMAATFRQNAAHYARQGRRLLALASKRVTEQGDPEAEVTSGGYTLIGLVAMHDPPRAEVAGAVARCRSAGIRVLVVSGDHPLTVEAIAREVGIVHGPTPVIHTGADLANWSKAALRRALAAREVLFARTSSLDKLHIVTVLQEMGNIVAVTGDGVNDAPALKRADIGIAMGQSGTDVAREAADMVLLDDNFATIVAAVEEGRVIYDNIRRFIGYVLTSNVPEILPYIAFVLLGIPLPLPVLLILAIDLGTDLAPAIALATEPAETDVMSRPPRPQSQRLLSRELLFSSYLLWGLVESGAGFAAYFWVLLAGGWTPGVDLGPADTLYRQAIAAFFSTIVICQVANVMIWRTTKQSVFAKGILQNHAVLAGIAIELALLFLIIETGIGFFVFGTAPLPVTVWIVPLTAALLMLCLGETVKAARRARSP